MTKRKDIIARVVNDAKKDGRIIGATIRLKKTGKCKEVNGGIRNIKITQDGDSYVVMENFFISPRKNGKRWQSILLNNILCVRKDGMIYKK